MFHRGLPRLRQIQQDCCPGGLLTMIKNGKVVEKPADVNILGEETPEGFIVSGLEIVRKRKIRNINIIKEKKIKEVDQPL